MFTSNINACLCLSDLLTRMKNTIQTLNTTTNKTSLLFVSSAVLAASQAIVLYILINDDSRKMKICEDKIKQTLLHDLNEKVSWHRLQGKPPRI